MQRLDAGDYSIEGLENSIAVERKSNSDYVNTIIHSKDRFTKELKKLSAYKAACIVVEGDIKDMWDKRIIGRASPNALLGLTISIITKWNVPVFFCGSRPMARLFTESWLVSVLWKYQGVLPLELEKTTPKH